MGSRSRSGGTEQAAGFGPPLSFTALNLCCAVSAVRIWSLWSWWPPEFPAQSGAPTQRHLWGCHSDTTPSWACSCGLAALSAAPSIAVNTNKCVSTLSNFCCRSTSSLPDPKYHRAEQDHSLFPPAIGNPAVDNIPGSPAVFGRRSRSDPGTLQIRIRCMQSLQFPENGTAVPELCGCECGSQQD